MIIQLESGQKLEVADNATPEQIDEVISHVAKPQHAEAPATQQIGGWKDYLPDATTIPAFSSGFNTGVESRGRGIAQAGLDVAGMLGMDVTAQKQNIVSKEAAATKKLETEFPNSKMAKVSNVIGNVAPLAIVAPLLPATFVGGGAAGGALEGATRATENKDTGIVSRTANTAIAAVEGAVVGAALKGVDAAIGAVFKRLKGAAPETAETLRKKASSLFQRADQEGGVLPATVTDDFLTRIKDNLVKEFKGDEVIMGLPGNKKYLDAVKEFDALKGQPLTFDRMEAFDKYIGNSARDAMDSGRATNLSRMLHDIQTEFRDTIKGANPPKGFQTFRDAQGLWLQSRKIADVEDIVSNANFMEQPSTAIRSGLRALLKNKSRMGGWSDAEKQALRSAIKTGRFPDVIRTLGSRLMGIGSVVMGDATTAAVKIGGSMAARETATAMKNSQASKLTGLLAGEKPKQFIPKGLSALTGAAATNYTGGTK